MKKRTVPIANAQALFFSNGQIQMDKTISKLTQSPQHRPCPTEYNCGVTVAAAATFVSWK